MLKLSRVSSRRDAAIGSQFTYESIQSPQQSLGCFPAFTRRRAQFLVKVDEIAAMDKPIRELKVPKFASEPPVENAQVILQALLLGVKRKPAASAN
jgi:hypothetical protein